MKWGWPLDPIPPVRSHYDLKRLHPILRVVRPHTGTDWAVPSGTPVRAAAAGRVEATGYDADGAGLWVRLNHGDLITTRYYHLSVISVRTGQTVTLGQVIGRVGSTGMSTGPHLHFEVRLNNAHTDPFVFLNTMINIGEQMSEIDLDQRIPLAKGGRVSTNLNGLTSISVGGALGYSAANGWQGMIRMPRIEATLAVLTSAVNSLSKNPNLDTEELALNVAASLAPLLVEVMTEEMAGAGVLTPEQATAAAEAAIRNVLGSLAPTE